MEPNIIFENVEVLVINKPAGLVVHSDGKTKEDSLVDWLLLKYPEIREVGESGRDSLGNEIIRSGIVHRLDRETSGIMLVAKTQDSFYNLKNQFKEHSILKTYEAVVWGEMKNDEGTIDRPISRSSSDFRKWTAQRGGRGEEREAVTDYKVLTKSKGYSLVEVKPKTGRTHQIRVHFKAINYPLVGDKLYGPDKENDLGFTRLALHSLNVKFRLISGELLDLSAPYPEDFKRAREILQTV